jgi:hypothetical protein
MERKCVGSCEETCAVYALLNNDPAVEQMRVSTFAVLSADELRAEGVTPNMLAQQCNDRAPHRLFMGFGKLACGSRLTGEQPMGRNGSLSEHFLRDSL